MTRPESIAHALCAANLYDAALAWRRRKDSPTAAAVALVGVYLIAMHASFSLGIVWALSLAWRDGHTDVVYAVLVSAAAAVVGVATWSAIAPAEPGTDLDTIPDAEIVDEDADADPYDFEQDSPWATHSRPAQPEASPEKQEV